MIWFALLCSFAYWFENPVLSEKAGRYRVFLMRKQKFKHLYLILLRNCTIYNFQHVQIFTILEFVGKNLDLKFETLALGHYGILVSWDPSQEPNPSDVKYHFYYQLPGNSTYKRRKDTTSTSDVNDGQVKIYNLEENSKYEIIVERREKRQVSTE